MVDMLDEGQDYGLQRRPCACYCSIAEDHIWFPAMLVSSQLPRNPAARDMMPSSSRQGYLHTDGIHTDTQTHGKHFKSFKKKKRN